jgi:hypothetical protein
VSIAIATAVPLTVVFLSGASLTTLGDLYAFGLLGAFSVSCVSLDILRWHDRRAQHRRHRSKRNLGTSLPVFALGVATTAAVLAAWATNLFAKPLATLYGGGLLAAGLLVAFVTVRVGSRKGRRAIFPYLHRPGHPTVLLHRGRRLEPPAVLAILPADAAKVPKVVARALARANGESVVFAFRGREKRTRALKLLEILDPYDEDKDAQAAFAVAEAAARKAGVPARYVYIPPDAEEGTEDWWRQDLRPGEVVGA